MHSIISLYFNLHLIDVTLSIHMQSYQVYICLDISSFFSESPPAMNAWLSMFGLNQFQDVWPIEKNFWVRTSEHKSA
jgi:hypothetical protein